ncbi:MAG TPA: hypothetical protein VN937_01975 [Blastocatellia bacterium]|nr:hypothetical protein [Blastocatellia bacterium]
MQTIRYQKKVRFLKLAAIASVAALAVFAQFQKTAAAQDPSGRLFELVGMTVPLEQRIGIDDGAAFVVHFSGDTHGNLDTCG